MSMLKNPKLVKIISVENVKPWTFYRMNSRRLYKKNLNEIQLEVDISTFATHEVCFHTGIWGADPNPNIEHGIVWYMAHNLPPIRANAKILIYNNLIYKILTWTDLFGIPTRENQLSRKKNGKIIWYLFLLSDEISTKLKSESDDRIGEIG